MIESSQTKQWTYHSTKTCLRLRYFNKQLFCVDEENRLYIWMSEIWQNVTSHKVRDLDMFYNKESMVAIMDIDNNWYAYTIDFAGKTPSILTALM